MEGDACLLGAGVRQAPACLPTCRWLTPRRAGGRASGAGCRDDTRADLPVVDGSQGGLHCGAISGEHMGLSVTVLAEGQACCLQRSTGWGLSREDLVLLG